MRDLHAPVRVAALLLMASCCCTATVTPAGASDQLLQFVTIGSAGGCPVSLYYSASTWAAYLAPTLCLVADSASLAAACPRFDMAMGANYLDIPLRVTNAALLAQAEDTFRPLLANRTLAFLQPVVSSVRTRSSLGGSHKNLKAMELELELGLEAGTDGFLRLACRNESCGEFRKEPPDGLWDAVEQAEFELELAPPSSSGVWQSVKMKQRIHVANRGRILTASHAASSQVLPAPMCTNLNQHQHVTISDSCRVTVHRRTDRKGHFVMEPMLCYHGNFTEQDGTVRITLAVTSSEVRNSVARALSPLSPLSVTFMSMVGAELRVSESLQQVRTGWSFETLARLATDGDSAELLVRCGTADSCSPLLLALIANPRDLMRHVQFSVESQLVESRTCSHQSVKLGMALKNDSACQPAVNASRLLTSYHTINGFLCIRPEFVKSMPTASAENCAFACTRQRHCQAFSVENGMCRQFVFHKCSKSVRDCSCSRRGQVFVKKQPGLQPGKLCPEGYGDDLCGVKYKAYPGPVNWTAGRRKCKADSGLVIMADVVDATEMEHVNMLYSKYSRSGTSLWLGGAQAPGSPEPAGGWSWVACGLSVNSGLWGSGEPNNYKGIEHYISRWPGASGLNDWKEGNVADPLCECVSPFG